jgi:TPR repeat protein
VKGYLYKAFVLALLTFCLIWRFGIGDKTDEEILNEWRTEANNGNVESMYMLAFNLDIGMGDVPEDNEEALIWYRKAAENGHADAQHHLAGSYIWTEDLHETNLVEAYAWYAVSMRNGNEISDEYMDKIKAQLSQDEQVEAEILAKEYIQQYTKK